LLQGLSSDNRRMRADAAEALAVQLEGIGDMAKLLLLIECSLEPTVEHLENAARHCWEKNFTSVGLQLAETCVSQSNAGVAYLRRGIAREQAGLRSIAFSDYRAAAQSGISVAKANMAWMLNQSAVPEAGLEILRDHLGTFDAADPGRPYEARAVLERSVENERARERALCASGARAIKAMQRMLDAWRHETTESPPHSRWIATSRTSVISVSLEPEVIVTVDGRALATEPVQPFADLFVASDDNSPRILLLLRKTPEAVSFSDLKGGGFVDWLELTPVEGHRSYVLAGDSSILDAGETRPMLEAI
jgi:hypothetical protein